MCIIVYKPKESKFPTKDILKNCFTNNPDGAGFMYAKDGKVFIEKGLMTFSKFWKSLQNVRKANGDNLDYVLHFRISTQAGTRADCTHPFPLAKEMKKLRELSTTAEIGVAHNGIITLTSGGYGYGNYLYSYTKQITYNDTMEFITDYLSLIIKNKDFYKDKDTVELITRLCESKLAILDGDGHCTLIGSGWIVDDDVVYSNDSYEPKVVKMKSVDKTKETKTTYLTDEDGLEFYCSGYCGDEKYYDCAHCKYYFDCYGDNHIVENSISKNNDIECVYNFNPTTCPLFTDGDDSYCEYCVNRNNCYIEE